MRPVFHDRAHDQQKPQLPLDLKAASAAYEIELINHAMDAAKHNQRRAAELLERLTYHQLRGYLKKYDLLGKPGAQDDAGA